MLSLLKYVYTDEPTACRKLAHRISTHNTICITCNSSGYKLTFVVGGDLSGEEEKLQVFEEEDADILTGGHRYWIKKSVQRRYDIKLVL